jgi:multifunctional beta-oxidation protein
MEDVAAKWDDITRFDGRANHIEFGRQSFAQMQANYGNVGPDFAWGSNYDPADPELVKQAKKQTLTVETTHDARDSILYNLGLGATETELQYVYELDEGFRLIPSYGVIPLSRAGHDIKRA